MREREARWFERLGIPFVPGSWTGDGDEKRHAMPDAGLRVKGKRKAALSAYEDGFRY